MMEQWSIQLLHLVITLAYSTNNWFHKIFIFNLFLNKGEYIYGPSSQEAAATIRFLTKAFCKEYKINQEALAAGKPGILIGRYPNDGYAGGNPWQLLTAVLGEVFYLGADATLKSIEQKGVSDYNLDVEENKEWIKLLDTYNSKKCWFLLNFFK